MHQRGTVTTGRTSVWMTTNAKPCRLRDSTPTIPRSLRGSTLPDGNSRWVFEITAPRQHRAEPGTAGQSAVRTPPCRIGGRPESYGRRSMSTAGAQPAPGLVRADVRMGTAPAVEPSAGRLCSGPARRLRAWCQIRRGHTIATALSTSFARSGHRSYIS
jgi:hypothetical protein